jgi:hypothetical protein
MADEPANWFREAAAWIVVFRSEMSVVGSFSYG